MDEGDTRKAGGYREYIHNEPVMLICYIVSLNAHKEKRKKKKTKKRIDRRARNKLSTKKHPPSLQKQRTYFPLPFPSLPIKRLNSILQPTLPNYSIRHACNLFPRSFRPSLASTNTRIRICLGSSPAPVLGPYLRRIPS